MFVTERGYREYEQEEGARMYAWMLFENGLTVEQVLASVIAMEDA